MDPTRGESAADFLARADERHIAEVIRDHGEERFAVPIAKALVARREGGNPVRTTGELSEVVARAVKTREPGQDPATRTFQGLRIHVNAELEELEQGLKSGVELLQPSGRLVVISFHSLEDRIVKTFIARESRSEVDRRAPFAPEKPHRLKSLGRIKPSDGRGARQPARALGGDACGRAHGGAGMTRRATSMLLRRCCWPAACTWCACPTTRGACSPSSTGAQRGACAGHRVRAPEGRAPGAGHAAEGRAASRASKLAMRNATPAVTQYVTYAACRPRRRPPERRDEARQALPARRPAPGARAQRRQQRAQRRLLDQPAAGLEDAAVALEVHRRPGRR